MSKPGKLPTHAQFAPAPAGAPVQVSQPLTGDVLRAMQDRARQHEKPLAPLRFDQKDQAPAPVTEPPSPVPATGPAPLPPSVAEASPIPLATGSGEVPDPVLSLQQLEGEFAQATAQPGAAASSPGGPDPDPDPDPDPGFRRPAESDTDSPARGIPRPIHDEGKQITGGWGAQGGGNQYFALDGLELQTVSQALMSDLIQRMARDLRFGMAAVYPQVRVRVTLTVDGSSPDASINDVAFTLDAARLLTLDALAQDDPDTPADAIRDAAGLTRPMKRPIRAGAATIMVDVPSPGARA